jgi:hypothetical protein
MVVQEVMFLEVVLRLSTPPPTPRGEASIRGASRFTSAQQERSYTTVSATCFETKSLLGIKLEMIVLPSVAGSLISFPLRSEILFIILRQVALFGWVSMILTQRAIFNGFLELL